MFNETTSLLLLIKQQKPLILNLTNLVTMDFIANGLLSLGASPIMSQAEEEMEDLIKMAAAVVINLGTLDKSFITLCHQACALAQTWQKPIILDPVGAGASTYRTEASLDFINNYRIAMIRGNGSEILALSQSCGYTKGVDSTIDSAQAQASATLLSQHYQTTVVISGQKDIIVEGERLQQVERGSAWLPQITGSGCLLSAVVGAFHAVTTDRFAAALAAIWFYSICGEIAAEKAAGPGSFKMHFLDALHTLPPGAYYASN